MTITAIRGGSPEASEDVGFRDSATSVMWRLWSAAGVIPSAPDEGDDMSATRLKHIVYTVHECCETTILNPRFESLVPKLEAYDDELQGFAYEGAGVGLAALDCMFPRSDRTRALATGPGAHHVFGIYLGAGMCLARIRKNPESFRQKLGDPLMSWTVLDGYGFYRGFFHYDRFVTQKHVPPHLQGYGRRVYDQGLGRAIWFSADADVELVATTIEAFLPQRQADLWSGVGFACGYSGGIEREALEPLPDLAGVHRAHLAVGAAIAAKARYLGGNPAPHNDLACDLLCGSTAKEASDVVDDAVVNLPPGVDVPAHALWRQRVLQEFL